MAAIFQRRQVWLLLASSLIFVFICGLIWLGQGAVRLPAGSLNPLAAYANEESLWTPTGDNIPILRRSDDQEWPAIAYNTRDNEYLVVWQDHRDFDTMRLDIYARRLAPDGSISEDAFFIARQPMNQDFPHVAYNSTQNEYLVVWSDQRNIRTSSSDVYGRRVAADGTLLGRDIAISTALRPQLYPRVAYNPNSDEYLVVWQDSRGNITTGSDIYGQRIASDGSLLGSNFAIANESEAQNQPDVAYSPATQLYLVAWDDERQIDLSSVDIYAQMITGAGGLEGSNFPLSTDPRNQESVVIGYNADEDVFLAVWEDFRDLSTTNVDVYGQQVAGDGTPLGDDIPLSTGHSAERGPALAFDPGLNGYLLLWRDDRNERGTGGDIFGRALDSVGEQVGTEFEIGVEIGTQRRAEVAYNTEAEQFLVTWEDSRNFFIGGRDIYGQRVDQRIQPTATPTSTPTTTPTATATPTVTLTPTLTATSTPTPTATPTGPTHTPTATPILPTPTNTPCAYPPCPGRETTAYLPLVRLDQPLCGFSNPDADEPANNQWESATPYGYGRWEGRTFWDPSAPPGSEGSDVDWYKWVVEWTGTHWIWPENTSPHVEVYSEVYFATGDPRRPLELLAFGRGRHEVELVAGRTYYVKVKNVGTNPPSVGCYDLILDP